MRPPSQFRELSVVLNLMVRARHSVRAAFGHLSSRRGGECAPCLVPNHERVSWTFCVVLLAVLALGGCTKKEEGATEFVRLMNAGKTQYDAGQAQAAVEAFRKAAALDPASVDAHINLSAALLRSAKAEEALREAEQALKADATSAAALYLSGCAQMRLGRTESALRIFQQVKAMDRSVNAVSYQLGRAHQDSGQFEEARKQFEEVVEFELDHPAAHYSLSQVLLRLNRPDDAARSIEKHQQIMAARGSQPSDPFLVEKCVYTAARAPFILEQPDANGVKVRFSDATAPAFGAGAGSWRGPVAVLDLHQRGTNDLLVREPTGFRLLGQTNGVFAPRGVVLPVPPANLYSLALVGDLDNDRYEDVMVLGDKASHVFRFGTNAQVREATAFIGLKDLTASGGLLADLDFTGKLDLLAIVPGERGSKVYRNLGNYFTTKGVTSGPPAVVQGITQMVLDDWNNDDLPDVWVARDKAPPQLLIKQRGGGLVPTNAFPDLPAASFIAVGDLDNDLRSDLVLLTFTQLIALDGAGGKRTVLTENAAGLRKLSLIDYDNDGWLDVVAWGQGVRAWRNLGKAGFKETTATLALDKLGNDVIDDLKTADFDGDGDTDFLAVLSQGGLKLFRNDGGNANLQLKLRLLGNRSNASGIGHRVELISGGLRVGRFIRELPVEIGVGQHKQLESLTVKWSDLAPPIVEVPVVASTLLPIVELQSPTGSCPYLYVWDGTRFRFVTDLLGAAPVGLPVAENRYIQADTSEWVWMGGETEFKPRDGKYLVQITEELREALYLDTASMAVADHPEGTEVHPTNKLRPGPPFPAAELMTVGHRRPLLHAERLSGADVTGALQENDGKLVSPEALRGPQLRGMAEPHGLVLDFGPLAVKKPLVLALTGWLRFGGGMANMAASRHADFPFPFPVMEAEVNGQWRPVDLVVGAPAGKTKTILVDLGGKLPEGTRRLRLSMAFEIHWDRAALFEKMDSSATRITRLAPTSTDLQWRGFSEFEKRPCYEPLTPDYDKVRQKPDWRIALTGWCTRYGEVDALLAGRDDALVIMNGGDALTLAFDAQSVPQRGNGMKRDFFLFTDGWDKDADFHVKLGTTIDPLPFHGMDDQLYGQQPRPVFPNDALMEQTRTRWSGPWTFSRRTQNSR